MLELNSTELTQKIIIEDDVTDRIPNILEKLGNFKSILSVSGKTTFELIGKKQKKHDYLYWEFHEQGGKQAIRLDDWKAVRLNVKNDPNPPIELYNLTSDLHEDKNAHLHLKFERKIPIETVGPLSNIISQGIKEKVFSTKYPESAAKAFISITAMVLQGIYSIEIESDEFKRKFLATFDFLERILGAKSGSILDVYKKKGGHYT